MKDCETTASSAAKIIAGAPLGQGSELGNADWRLTVPGGSAEGWFSSDVSDSSAAAMDDLSLTKPRLAVRPHRQLRRLRGHRRLGGRSGRVFSAAFRAWVADAWPGSWRSHDRKAGRGPLLLSSAFATNAGL